MKKCIKCGSHAFNLYAEEIDQGGFCDVHYWQGRAHRAEALAQPEQEPLGWIASMAHNDLRCGIYRDVTIYGAELDETIPIYTTPPKRPWTGLTDEDIAYAYTLEKNFAMQYVDAKLKEKNT